MAVGQCRHRTWHRKPRARDRMWQSMRILREFTAHDLEATAEAGHSNAKQYLLGLEAAGYLRRIRRTNFQRGGPQTAWRLIRDTGPKAPRLQSDGTTYDPNDHSEHPGGFRQ